MRRSGVAMGVVALLCLSAGAAASPVPPPFEPLRVREEAGTVEVGLWGRSYVFDAGPLPSQIHSQGVPLLVERPRFVSDDLEVVWRPPTILRAEPDAVRLRSGGRLGSVQVYAETQIEYDGMIAVTLQ